MALRFASCDRARRMTDARKGKSPMLVSLNPKEPHMGRMGLTPGCPMLARIHDFMAAWISTSLAQGLYPGVHFELSGWDAPVCYLPVLIRKVAMDWPGCNIPPTSAPLDDTG